MMKQKYIFKRSLLLFFGLWSLVATAQHTVSGVVTSQTDGETLIGVSVVSKTNNTITGVDGSYTLSVSDPNADLTFSYVGFVTQTIALNGKKTLDVVLSEDAQLLDQVVVVGYGTQRKSDLTGAIGSVKSKDIERIPVANIEQALQGKIAGVYVSPASGTPGAGAVIRIRGTGTLNNANPLYVIDGMITYDASMVSPQDVASIEVLKDASAAAIYGSRGANGVIIITTKNGKKTGDAVVSLSSYYGVQQVTKQIAMANAAEFATLYNEFRGVPYYTNPDSLGEGTNWQDEIFRDAPIRSVQVGASGGGEKYTYNVSGNYFGQDGVVKNSNYTRFTLRVNNEWKLKPWLSLGNNLSYAISSSQIAPDAVGAAYRMPPVFAPKDSAGNYTDPTFFGLAIANPAADLEYKSNNHTKGNRLFGNVYAEVGLLKYVKFRSSFGFDRADGQSKYFEPKYEVSPSQLNKNDRLSVGITQKRDWIWEQTLRFERQIGKHSVNVLAGYTADERYSEYLGASRENFPGTSDDLLYLSAGNDTTTQNYGGAQDEAMISYLFRVNYTFADRYLITASWRTDQSSRFAAANRMGNFPSVSVGWNAGQEQFIKNLGIFDRFKLRASYGILGNQASARAYPSTGVVTSGLYGVFGPNESLNQGATLTSLANANLKWETSRQTDFGAEMGFFNNRLEIEADWYSRFTYDIIAAVPIPDYVGSLEDPIVNTAEVSNKGWDITANWRENGRNLTWNLGATVSPMQNEVVALAKGKSEIFAGFLQGEPASHTVVGLPIGAFYGYKVAGIFQNTEDLASLPKIGGEEVGDVRYTDLNADGIIDADDRTYLGSPIPTLTYSFTGGLEAFGFDLAADLFGTRGNKVFNAKKTFRFSVYNWEQSFTDRWTPEKPSLTEPRITNGGHNYRVSDRFLEDGSFVRLRSLSIGYTLPAKLLDKVKIKRLRIYVLGNNIWTKQAYSGYSPEFPNSESPFEVGFDRGGYPIAKSWQVGIDAAF